jgi:hypothetical protein
MTRSDLRAKEVGLTIGAAARVLGEGNLSPALLKVGKPELRAEDAALLKVGEW